MKGNYVNLSDIKYLISMIVWYIIGIVSIYYFWINISPYNKDFVLSFGIFISISIILIMILDLLSIIHH